MINSPLMRDMLPSLVVSILFRLGDHTTELSEALVESVKLFRIAWLSTRPPNNECIFTTSGGQNV